MFQTTNQLYSDSRCPSSLKSEGADAACHGPTELKVGWSANLCRDSMA